MPSLLSRYDAAASPTRFALPVALALLVFSALENVFTPVRHSLLVHALAWGGVSACAVLFSTGWKSVFEEGSGRKSAWMAGGLLALAAVGERAVGGRGIWWAKALLPLVLYIFAQNDLLRYDTTGHSPDPYPASPSKPGAIQQSRIGAKTSLTILSSSAVVATFAATGSNSAIPLGLSMAIVQALAFCLIEKARSEALDVRAGGGSIIYSANSLHSHPNRLVTNSNRRDANKIDPTVAVIRDVALMAMLASAAAALCMERFTFGGLTYYIDVYHDPAIHEGVGFLDFLLGLAMVLNDMMANGMLVFVVQRQSASLASFILLSAGAISQLYVDFSILRLWFAGLAAASAAFFLDEQDSLVVSTRAKSRTARLLSLLGAISFGFLMLRNVRPAQQDIKRLSRYAHVNNVLGSADFADSTDDAQPFMDGHVLTSDQTSHGHLFSLHDVPSPGPMNPLQYTNSQVHPIHHLIQNAESEWSRKLQAQSKTLEEAVAEYQRRYQIPPPPNFDKWFEFAKRKGVQLIDEYDTIYHSLLPFWGLPPATIRARTSEALGFPNTLVGLLIRNGKAQHVEGDPEWLRKALVGMTGEFVEYLPDMDLAFNTHDEPRVVVPHDELSRLIQIALSQRLPEAFSNQSPKNSFSPTPFDANSGRRIAEVKTTRFNVFAHQPTWIPSRLSCSPDSPSRALFEADAIDNRTSYALGPLGFVYNQTAFSDVCNSPSLSRTHGFFDRPNAFNVVHDLFPIFSQSKMSSFQDILYPSPWYWYGKVNYDEKQDLEWQQKVNRLFWRGSTTGGFSRAGGWRRQHRQHIVQKINAQDTAEIMQDVSKSSSSGTPLSSTSRSAPDWQVKQVPRVDYNNSMDVHFSHVGQCDPGDCAAQREFFTIADEVPQHQSWKFRYLLDMDGNAFSGRFYAFLKSHSLTFKMAVFREWHEEWIKPWVHYIPLSLRADEALEAVRWFSAEEEGKETAVRLAEAGREWANKALRNEDLEVWFFRLLLEYGRLIDDNRANIGFTGS